MDKYNTTFETFKRFFVETILSFLLDLIFPKSDFIKNLENVSAREALESFPRCLDKRGVIPELQDIIVPFQYRDKRVKNFVREIKYKGNKKIIKTCGEILNEIIKKEIVSYNLTSPILIPIPLSNERRKERGFNQNELLIKEVLAINNNIGFSFDSIAKIKNTVAQSSIKNRRKRMENLKGCFVVINPKFVCGKNIILVDDVVTTGSTLREARAVLLSAGARHVFAIAIAH